MECKNVTVLSGLIAHHYQDNKTKLTVRPNSPQVPKSIDEHASDGKSTGSLIMGPNGQSEIVFQNYLGIGVDAQAALRFHQTRNSKPNLFFSQATNKILYGVFGAKDFLEHSMAGLNRDCLIYADGVLQDIVFWIGEAGNSTTGIPRRF